LTGERQPNNDYLCPKGAWSGSHHTGIGSNLETVQAWDIVVIQDYIQTIKWCHYLWPWK